MVVGTTIWPFPVIRLFQKGLSRLKVDFLNSLHIQEAEITRWHLQRKIRRSYERHRRRLRSHERHGIHVVDPSGREVSFLPSDSYTYPKRKRNCSPDRARNNAQAATIHYLSTRRPQEHLRQISRDLQTTLPTVAAFVLVPGVGYTFLLLGMMFPRLLLSRQFHTSEQRREFALKEYGERRVWWEMLNGNVWGGCVRNMPGLVFCEDEIRGGEKQQNYDDRNDNIPEFLEPLSSLRMDAAGPVFGKQSMFRLYHIFQLIGQRKVATPGSPSIKNLQTTHLHFLALSNNLAAPIYLPSDIAPLFLQTFYPAIYLQHKLTSLAEDIIMDDAALIEEGELEGNCNGMTEDEVLDACWLRGLPVGRYATVNIADESSVGVGNEVHVMRNVLTHHLQMMKNLMIERSSSTSEGTKNCLRPKGDLVRDATLQLLILHLPAVRHSMKMHLKK